MLPTGLNWKKSKSAAREPGRDLFLCGNGPSKKWKKKKEMIKYSRLWETNPLNKLSTSLFFLVSASKSGTRSGAEPHHPFRLCSLTVLKWKILSLLFRFLTKLHRMLMLMCLGIFLPTTMLLEELKRTKCCFSSLFAWILNVLMINSWKSQITKMQKRCNTLDV